MIPRLFMAAPVLVLEFRFVRFLDPESTVVICRNVCQTVFAMTPRTTPSLAFVARYSPKISTWLTILSTANFKTTRTLSRFMIFCKTLRSSKIWEHQWTLQNFRTWIYRWLILAFLFLKGFKLIELSSCTGAACSTIDTSFPFNSEQSFIKKSFSKKNDIL